MNAIDPRPLYRDALAWTTSLAAAVTDDQMSLPTPCPDFDVRALIGHMVGGTERSRVVAGGGDFASVSVDLPNLPDPAADYASRAVAVLAAWEGDTLDTPVTVPWGTVPGRGAIFGYVNETLVHGWDLAVATGQNAETDPELADLILGVFRPFLPAEIRGLDDIPFGEVIEPRPEAGPTERLANWSGRSSLDWLVQA